jgi:hypothetical protein
MYMPKQINKSQSALLLVLVLAVSGISYYVGKARGDQAGFINGYSKGQVDLAVEIQAALNETVDAESDKRAYNHFKDIKDITLYIVTRNNVKTLASWKKRTEK